MLAKTKDPDSVVDFEVDWSAWLPEGDTIDTSEWFIASPADDDPPNPDYLNIDSDSNTATTTKVWLSKGVVRVVYKVTNRITTAAGRTEDQTLPIRIKEK